MSNGGTEYGVPAVELKGVSFSYGNGDVLENVDLSVGQRDFAWVVGPNGGGKTTLLKLMLGLLKPRTGSIRIFGEPVNQVRELIGYMPQYTALDPQYPATVLDIALMGRLQHGFFSRVSRQDRHAAEQALETVGLSDRATDSFSVLSGGQQRRLLIARALATKPDILVLDEPTANLDPGIERELFELLAVLNKHLAIVMVSHDPSYVSSTVERVICVNRKVAVHPTTAIQGGAVDDLYGERKRLVRHDLHDHDHHAGEDA